MMYVIHYRMLFSDEPSSRYEFPAMSDNQAIEIAAEWWQSRIEKIGKPPMLTFDRLERFHKVDWRPSG